MCSFFFIINSYSCCILTVLNGKLGGEPVRGMSKKIFVGRLPPEATTEDLRLYFGRFGHILDAYIPRVRCQIKQIQVLKAG
jgi:RNA recognition motif-containing protein